MTIKLSENTKEIIRKALDVESFKELQDRPYQDFSVDADVDREKAKIYAERNRGSVRLNTGRYFTLNEYADHLRKLRSVRLP